MRTHRLLLAVAASLAMTAAHGQSLGAESLITLRGLKIGAQCDSLQPSLERLRSEGFQLRAHEMRCATGGDFRSEVFIRWDGALTEELHLYFTPENTLWRVKTMTQWGRVHGAASRPTEAQLVASLEYRFGKPKSSSAPSAGGAASAWQYQATWESTTEPSLVRRLCGAVDPDCKAPAPTLPSVLTVASFNHVDAGGPAPQLLVDMFELAVAPRAESAYVKSLEMGEAAAAARDARMLPKL